MSNPVLAERQTNPFNPQFEPALARLARVPANRARKLRQRNAVSNTAHLPWSEVSLRSDLAASFSQAKRPPAYLWLVAAVALLLHVGAGWYVSTHTAHSINKPKPSEVSLQFERPKPPEPKVEPPKVQPTQAPIKRAQVLPPIQTATPEPSAAPAASNAEPPIAVAPVVSAPPAEPAPITVSAPIGGAGYLNNPPPDYPPVASRQGWQGTVVLRVHVLASGKPDVVEVQKSSGRKVLDDEAVRTVKNLWSYTPAKRGDTAVDGWTTTPIEFQIAS